MFLKHGFHQVSMDKIAKAAPASKATLYQHFENKNALFSAVIFDLCRSLLDTMTEITTDSDDIENNLRKIAEAFIELIYQEDALAMYRLVIAECRDFPELGRIVYENAPHIALRQLENYLDSLKAEGLMHITDIEFAADAFFSLLKGDRHFQCLLGIRPTPTADERKRWIDRAITLYLQGLTHDDA